MTEELFGVLFIVYLTCILIGVIIGGDKESLKGMRGAILILLLIINNLSLIYFVAKIGIIK